MRTQPLFESKLTNKYHYCGRCGVRSIIAQMRWENGVLVGPECQDEMLPQERDAMIDRAVAAAASSRELQPDLKITEGAGVETDEVSFIP